MGAVLHLRQWLTELGGIKRLIRTDHQAPAPSSTAVPDTTLARGHHAETQAADYLVDRGLKLRARNIRAGRGEIDLIMQDKDTLVFVEVRARKARAPVSALESISRSKRLKVIETAERILLSTPAWQHFPCRFDVVAVQTNPGTAPDHIEWIKDAFQPEGS